MQRVPPLPLSKSRQPDPEDAVWGGKDYTWIKENDDDTETEEPFDIDKNAYVHMTFSDKVEVHRKPS